MASRGKRKAGGRRGGGGAAAEESRDEDYEEKRRKNNEAVHRSREKTRLLEAETADKVKELKTENSELERRVEVLNKELGFLKEMFVAYASGKGREVGERSRRVVDGAAAFDALAQDPTPPSANTRRQQPSALAMATSTAGRGQALLSPTPASSLLPSTSQQNDDLQFEEFT